MSKTVNGCAKDIALVVPSDTESLAAADGQIPHALIVTGTTGTIKVTTGEGRVIVLPAAMFTIGDRFPLMVDKIHNTSTTATEIYVMYGAG